MCNEILPLIKEIYRLSKKVSEDLPFHATGIEKQLQEALHMNLESQKKRFRQLESFWGDLL